MIPREASALGLSVCLLLGVLAGCHRGGGGGGSNDGTNVGGENQDNTGAGGGGESGEKIPFIWWEGSLNGPWVVDATADGFRFRADTGNLFFGSTTYVNTFVTPEADIIWEGEVIGGVFGVLDQNGGVIAAMVGLNGCLLDLYGPEYALCWQPTDRVPVFADLSIGGPSSGPVRARPGLGAAGGEDVILEFDRLFLPRLASGCIDGPNATFVDGEAPFSLLSRPSRDGLGAPPPMSSRSGR